MNCLLDLNLVINAKKTKYIIFKSRNMHTTDIFHSLMINNEKIDSVNEYNYLGLIIDEKQNWSSHVAKVANKISPYVGILKRLRHFVNHKTLMLIYYSYIDSHLIYVLPIWARRQKLI